MTFQIRLLGRLQKKSSPKPKLTSPVGQVATKIVAKLTRVASAGATKVKTPKRSKSEAGAEKEQSFSRIPSFSKKAKSTLAAK